VPNPWLDIPPDDYVGHMSDAVVAQHQALNRILRETLEDVRPASVLVLGCSTGNGFEHIDPGATSRVVGVDINPNYLQRLRERFPGPAFALELHCTDLSDHRFEPAAFDLVHAPLVFEYVDWSNVLHGAVAALRTGGALSVVVQLRSSATPAVTPTRFTSLRSLESIFCFVDPEALVTAAVGCGLRLESRRTEHLPSAKAFEVLRLRATGVR